MADQAESGGILAQEDAGRLGRLGIRRIAMAGIAIHHSLRTKQARLGSIGNAIAILIEEPDAVATPVRRVEARRGGQRPAEGMVARPEVALGRIHHMGRTAVAADVGRRAGQRHEQAGQQRPAQGKRNHRHAANATRGTDAGARTIT